MKKMRKLIKLLKIHITGMADMTSFMLYRPESQSKFVFALIKGQRTTNETKFIIIDSLMLFVHASFSWAASPHYHMS